MDVSEGDGHYSFLVLGAGVVGLSTALQCHLTWPRCRVTVMADKFGAETTSSGAGGIFRPTLGKLPGVAPHVLRQWLSDSWAHYDHLAHSVDAGKCGTQVLSGYQFYNNTPENSLEKEFVYHYRELTERELKMFPGTDTVSHGFYVTTLMTEGYIYLQYLTQKLKRRGVKLVRHKVKSMQELVGRYDLVFNCTGIGSQELLNDQKLVPIRGQLIQVRAPWIKHSLLFGDEQLCFIYPGQHHCVVGCTRQVGDYDMRMREQDTDEMWENACRLVPSLRRAERLSEWVGLRPHRQPLRIEKEIFSHEKQHLKVVHNYGHGAEGISLSWGTSVNAIQLAKEMLDESAESPINIHSKL